MTESALQKMEAEIKASLCYKIPTSIQTYNHWEDTINNSTDVVMEIVRQYIKEDSDGK